MAEASSTPVKPHQPPATAEPMSPPSSSESAEGEATVVMVEPITAAHTSSGSGIMDIKPLLQLMDICTCASAEKHTGVNCVTASMGDVVFEYAPQCGELLELTATPIFAGRTSLDIGLTVVAEGDGDIRRFVCYACFTYVTTRGPDGKKRYCPALESVTNAGGSSNTTAIITPQDETNMPESVQWARTVAYYRRALVKAEMKASTLVKNEQGLGSGFDLELSEVVLPAHQNHMGHTFGGIVMSWMAKAALAEASRKAKRMIGSLLIRSVLRVEFASGSDVSDHLIFRPRLNAIFDDGGSAEIEVRVSKRDIKTGTECSMNVGYFYVSGVEVRTGTDKPFATSLDFCSTASKDVRGRIKADATWRRRLLLARRRLLGGVGNAVEWHPSLQEEGPLLTILAVLRLVYHEDREIQWKPLNTGLLESRNTPEVDTKKLASSFKQSGAGPIDSFHLEWTSGEAFGRENTFVLRAKRILLNTTVPALFDAIKNRRPEWDELCSSIALIEEDQNTPEYLDNNSGLSEEDGVAPTTIHWDIVEHNAITPQNAMTLGYFCCIKTRSIPRRRVNLCLFRAWKLDENDSGTAVLASQSVRHVDAVKDSLTEVLPSGWFLRPINDHDGNTSGVALTYVVEHDLVHLRSLAPSLSDKNIISTFAKTARQWFKNLADITGTTATMNK